MERIRHNPGRHLGIGLIEILIALLVLSVGLLGLAALQGMALQSTRAAYHHTQAVQAGSELLDYLRAHHGIACAQGPETVPGFAVTVARMQARLPHGQIGVQTGEGCGLEIEVRWNEAGLDDEAASEVVLTSRL